MPTRRKPLSSRIRPIEPEWKLVCERNHYKPAFKYQPGHGQATEIWPTYAKFECAVYMYDLLQIGMYIGLYNCILPVDSHDLPTALLLIFARFFILFGPHDLFVDWILDMKTRTLRNVRKAKTMLRWVQFVRLLLGSVEALFSWRLCQQDIHDVERSSAFIIAGSLIAMNLFFVIVMHWGTDYFIQPLINEFTANGAPEKSPRLLVELPPY